MANKYDLKIVQKTLDGGSSGTDLGIGAVSTGKTRFVCWIKLYSPTGSSGDTVSIGEADAATGALSTVKDKQAVAAGDTLTWPDKIDMDNPLFSISAGKYLGVTSTATDSEITIVYYDE